MRHIGAAVIAAALVQTGQIRAEEPVEIGPVQVTATRSLEPVDRAPVFISVISGEDLRARRVTDLRGALAGVAGAEAPGGGDTGPAGAVPAFWGLHEFDAFLLVVDGVPLGGAFNPAIPDLNLTDVERIEVLKGAAPVLFGATAFVGVIQVIHRPAGQADQQISAGIGTDASWRASASLALPDIAGLKQSIAADFKRDGYGDRRERVRVGRALYRAGGEIGGGTLRLDFDYAATRTIPNSPTPRVGSTLTPLIPIDANFNPSDARLDEDRIHAVVGWSRPTILGTWDTTISLAYSRIDDVRGFLRSDLINADSQIQGRDLHDDYADTHLATELGRGANLTWGADLLYGRASQASRNGGYTPALDGSAALPRAADLHVDETNGLYDRRIFAGQYAQLDWRVGSRWDFNGGLRLNETYERKQSSHIDGFDPEANTFDDRKRAVTRLSGMAGLTFRAWTERTDELAVYANYRDTFKPAAVDFGPDNTPDILAPETARSYELGLKGRILGGRLDYQLGVFRLDFSNLVIAVTDAAGDPMLENAGGERLQGVEAEGRWRMSSRLAVTGAGSWHDARFTHYVGAEGDVSGHRLTLAPHWLGSLGVTYAPTSGFFGSVNFAYVGERYLDLANSALAGAYVTVDASVGWRWRRYGLSINGTNLSDERPPVTASEFGDQSFYRLVGRRVFVEISAAL